MVREISDYDKLEGINIRIDAMIRERSILQYDIEAALRNLDKGSDTYSIIRAELLQKLGQLHVLDV